MKTFLALKHRGLESLSFLKAEEALHRWLFLNNAISYNFPEHVLLYPHQYCEMKWTKLILSLRHQKCF